MDDFLTPRLRPFADLQVEVGAPLEVGDVGEAGAARRRVIPITGGQAQGVDGWRAEVLPGGADYQQIVGGTLAVLEAHYVLRLEGSGALVYVRNQAIRHASAEVTARLVRGEPVDPAQVYFRCQPRLETADAALSWVNQRLLLGTGLREPGRVVMRFFVLE